MRKHYEVVIVGAGPAGSVLALLLARRGIDVLLLDRAAHPRHKPCGDCLSAEAARLLHRIGLEETVQALGPASLRGWRIFAPGGRHFAASFDQLGDPDPRVHCALAVPRSRFDHALFEAARRAGADTLQATVTDLHFQRGAVAGVHARVADDECTIAARVTIGADGLRSRVARRLGALARAPRVRKLSLTTHTSIGRSLDGFGEMHSGHGICVGVAPVDSEGVLHNVTVVADAARFGRAAARDPRAFFARALHALPGLHLGDVTPAELLASGPFDAPMRRVAFHGAALVGDAAGYFDPFTGQGVYHALAGAERLAPILAQALAQPGGVLTASELAPWTRACHSLAAGTRRVQRIIDGVLARPALANAAIALLDARPAAARTLLAVTGDLRPARSLLTSAFALSLFSSPP